MRVGLELEDCQESQGEPWERFQETERGVVTGHELEQTLVVKMIQVEIAPLESDT
jgi:hypothetical protein